MKVFLFVFLVILSSSVMAEPLEAVMQEQEAYIDPRYHHPAEIENFLQLTAKKYQEITKVMVIGHSVKGAPIYAIKISDRASLEEDEPAIYINALHHAREIMTPEIAVDMIEFLTRNYQSDARVRKWVDSSQIWIVPMVNVDGNQRVWDGPISKTWVQRNNANGVDLNRNYPNYWQGCPSGKKASDAGQRPVSEPEVKAIVELVKKIRPVISLSYHSYSELVVYPPGCANVQPNSFVEKFGKELARLLRYKPGQPHETMGYEISGGDLDWLAHMQVMPYTIEINTVKENFYPDYDHSRNATVLRNRVGWMRVLDRLHESSFQGKVDRAQFDEILVSQRGQIVKKYKINPNGTFFIMLEKGLYDVEFSGRDRQSFQAVNVDRKVKLKL